MNSSATNEITVIKCEIPNDTVVVDSAPPIWVKDERAEAVRNRLINKLRLRQGYRNQGKMIVEIKFFFFNEIQL